ELALWDTSGYEDYDRLRPLSYPNSHVVIITFSIDSPDSLENVMEKWISEVKHFCYGIPILLVGCKKDRRNDPNTISELAKIGRIPVNSNEGFEAAQKIGAAIYLECSALTGEGVHEIFEIATRVSLTKPFQQSPQKKSKFNFFLRFGTSKHTSKSSVIPSKKNNFELLNPSSPEAPNEVQISGIAGAVDYLNLSRFTDDDIDIIQHLASSQDSISTSAPIWAELGLIASDTESLVATSGGSESELKSPQGNSTPVSNSLETLGITVPETESDLTKIVIESRSHGKSLTLPPVMPTMMHGSQESLLEYREVLDKEQLQPDSSPKISESEGSQPILSSMQLANNLRANSDIDNTYSLNTAKTFNDQENGEDSFKISSEIPPVDQQQDSGVSVSSENDFYTDFGRQGQDPVTQSDTQLLSSNREHSVQNFSSQVNFPKNNAHAQVQPTHSTTESQYDVMISYSWDNKSAALKIRNSLKKQGLSIWFDEENMGNWIYASMAEAVAKADIVMICLSSSYETSVNCMREFRYAADLKKRIIAVRVEDGLRSSEIELVISGSLWFKFHDGSAEKLKQVTDYITDEVKKNGKVISTKTQNPQKKEERMLKLKIIKRADISVFPGRILGKGAFAKVYRAIFDQEDVVVKELNDSVPSPMAKRSFLDEAALMACLTHPRIVTFYGIVDEQDQLCIVMEYMSNGSLHNIIHNCDLLPLDTKKRTQIAADVAFGMKALHEIGVLHCDLKSQNILIGPDFRAKVADFGLSFIRNEISSKTNANLVKEVVGIAGTELYMAPELYSLSPKYTEKCDVFSFGVVLSEICTWSGPYGLSMKEIRGEVVYRLIIHGRQRPKLKLESGMSKEWEELVSRCWAHESNERPSFLDIIEMIFQINESRKQLELEELL
ncbi:GTP-binding protein Rho1, partial [Nowakowskiella sp. JEL0078]